MKKLYLTGIIMGFIMYFMLMATKISWLLLLLSVASFGYSIYLITTIISNYGKEKNQQES